MADYTAAPTPPPAPAPMAPPRERVGLGLLGALGGVVLGVVLTVVVYRLGFVAGITSFVLAVAASYLYTLAAGSAPRRGLVPLILLIVLGVVVSFFAIVASDLSQAYTDHAGPGAISRTAFIRKEIFDGEVLKTYGHTIFFFALFAVLGVFGTLRRLMGHRR